MPGLTLRGCLFALPTLGLRTGGCAGSVAPGEWPTPPPAAGNPNDGEDYTSWAERAERLKAKGINGNGAGMPLGITVQTPWPTPSMMDGLRAGKEDDPAYWLESAANKKAHGINKQFPLNIAAQVAGNDAWPTPKSGSNRNSRTAITGAHPSHPSPSDLGLEQAVECAGGVLPSEVGSVEELPLRFRDPSPWATPASRDFRHPNDPNGESRQRRAAQAPTSGDQLPNQVGGSLNPEWVELLMGWPSGWTNISAPCAGVWPGWPAGMGPEQFEFEPPRICPKGSVPGRVARLKALGNGVVPMQAEAAFLALLGGV